MKWLSKQSAEISNVRWQLILISNVNDIKTKGQTFRYRSLLLERKQNVLVWSAYYRNESKTYWFSPKIFLLRADRFPFGPKILGRSKVIWFGLEIVLCKVERFYLIQKLIDRSKRFWFGSLIIGTKAKHFDLVCLLSELKQNILIWSAYYRNKSKTFCFGLLIIATKAKHFDLVCLLSERKQNVLIWSAYYRN